MRIVLDRDASGECRETHLVRWKRNQSDSNQIVSIQEFESAGESANKTSVRGKRNLALPSSLWLLYRFAQVKELSDENRSLGDLLAVPQARHKELGGSDKE